MKTYLEKKKVFITGTTNGIGRALALMLLKNGSQVIAHGRSGELLEDLVLTAGPGNITTVIGDLGAGEGWQAVDNAIKTTQPEILVLNAGYNCRKSHVSGWTNTEIMEMLQVNMISPIMFARTFAGLPQAEEPRRLAIILSTSCISPRPTMSLYVAAKTGLMGFGKVMQLEAKELGVLTTLFYPGRTNSNFRKTPNPAYMSPKSVAQTVISILNLPPDIVPFEFTFRPRIDTAI